MSVINSYSVTVCPCCYVYIANNDECDHGCTPCDLGLEQNETAVPVIPADGESPEIRMFRCAGCGDDTMGEAHQVDILTSL